MIERYKTLVLVVFFSLLGSCGENADPLLDGADAIALALEWADSKGVYVDGPDYYSINPNPRLEKIGDGSSYYVYFDILYPVDAGFRPDYSLRLTVDRREGKITHVFGRDMQRFGISEIDL